MATTIFHLEINIQGEITHTYYLSLKALIIDNSEELPFSESLLQKWSANTRKKGAPVIEKDDYTIRRGKAINTREAKENNPIDQLPPDVGAEHFE